jgi:Transcriptional regulatory protein, C terminal/FHA domain
MRLGFEDCLFDTDTREVFRSGKPVSISPKAFGLLEILVQRRPAAVSKDELHGLLWPDTFVSDANLPNLVAELRAALGDDARVPRIIRTVQRFGYAFCAALPGEPRGRAQPSLYRLIWGDREIALAPGENLLGRETSAVVWIDEAQVSRRHARILIGDSKAVLEDLGSRNGTRWRGEKIRSAVELADGDLIAVGSASMVFRVLRQTDTTASAVEEEA